MNENHLQALVCHILDILVWGIQRLEVHTRDPINASEDDHIHMKVTVLTWFASEAA